MAFPFFASVVLFNQKRDPTFLKINFLSIVFNLLAVKVKEISTKAAARFCPYGHSF
jgi:hypothetical protein